MTKDEEERYYNEKADRDIKHISVPIISIFERLAQALEAQDEKEKK